MAGRGRLLRSAWCGTRTRTASSRRCSRRPSTGAIFTRSMPSIWKPRRWRSACAIRRPARSGCNGGTTRLAGISEAAPGNPVADAMLDDDGAQRHRHLARAVADRCQAAGALSGHDIRPKPNSSCLPRRPTGAIFLMAAQVLGGAPSEATKLACHHAGGRSRAQASVSPERGSVRCGLNVATVTARLARR